MKIHLIKKSRDYKLYGIILNSNKLNNSSIKSLAQYFNEQDRLEFVNLPTQRKELLKQNKWIEINGITALHSKYSPEQQIYALIKCQSTGVRATERLLKVSRRTLQRWCRRYKINISRYPIWMDRWVDKKIRMKSFWEQRRGG